MSVIDDLIAGIAAISLFIYGLQGFGRELQTIGGSRLKDILGAATRSPTRGYLTGILATAIIQSSSAVSAFVVSFVDVGIVSFRGALAVILGANVGTASTAFLVSFKIGVYGSYFVAAGFVLSLVTRGRPALAGKAIFYFGLILFALDLTAQELGGLRDHPDTLRLLSQTSSPLVGIAVGALVTAVVQSSSITIGVAVVLTQQGFLPMSAVAPLVVGANIGTTSTALMASLSMNASARRVALANMIFNATAAVVALPVLFVTAGHELPGADNPEFAVAIVHLSFNLLVSMIGFGLIGPIVRHWKAG